MPENERIRELFLYLKTNRIVRNQQDFIERIGSNSATISQVMNDKYKASRRLLGKIAAAFPNVSKEWLFEGRGEMNAAPFSSGSVSHALVSAHAAEAMAALNKAVDEIAEQRKLVTKAQEQMDRLLLLLEKVQGRVEA